MKTLLKITVLFSLLACTLAPARAQDMQAGTKIIQAGVGLGGWADYSSQTPILSVSYMQGIKDDFLNGQLAVGGSIGYKSATYNSVYDYTWQWTYTFISGRATWHPNFIKSEKFDAYAGLGLGLLMVSFDAQGDVYAVDANGSTMVLTGLIGARYAINENWGAYAEIGNNLGYLTLGASYRF
jgi:hypothetical protein